MPMNVRISLVSVLGVVLGLVGETARAQVDVTTGRIAGTIVDADGQPLPGATIAAKNKATGLTLTGLTDARGTYRIVSIPVGTYSVTASLSGFGSRNEPSVVITLGSAPTVDFKLDLVPRSATVAITGEVPAIETTQTVSQTTVDNNAIRSLPNNGRNFTDFVLLAPSAQKDPVHGNIQLGRPARHQHERHARRRRLQRRVLRRFLGRRLRRRPRPAHALAGVRP